MSPSLQEMRVRAARIASRYGEAFIFRWATKRGYEYFALASRPATLGSAEFVERLAA